jgi:helicase
MEPVLPELVSHRLVQKKGTRIELSPLARVMSEHFVGIGRLLEIARLTGTMDDPLDIIAELESEDLQKETAPVSEKKRRHDHGKRRR